MADIASNQSLDDIAKSMVMSPDEVAGNKGDRQSREQQSGNKQEKQARRVVVNDATPRGGSAESDVAAVAKASSPDPAGQRNRSTPDADQQEAIQQRDPGDEDDSEDDFEDDEDQDDITAPPKQDEGDDGDEGEGEDEEYDPLADALAADHERDGAAGEQDAIDASKLGDDAKLSVTVDGEDRIVTLGELKRRYAGEGAIDKRVQEATEARNKAIEDYNRGQQLTQQVLQHFGQLMFRRTIDAPDKRLLSTNPTAYHTQKALYDEETQALQGAQAQLYQLTTQLDEVHQQQRKEYRQQAAKKLREIMPVFNDPVKGPKVKEALVSAAKEIGYTDEQIAACDDPLMFKTVALAARELKRLKGVKAETPKPISRAMSKKAAPKKTSAARRQQAALARAEKTGSVDDVAASMIVQAPRKKRSLA